MTGYQLDFSSYITERTQDFTGREWVFAEIDRWLADPDGPTFFIITGEPGIGKTAIAGRLTQIRDIAASHFCIARQADTIDPVLFARSISQQLCGIDGFAIRILKESYINLMVVQNIQVNYGTVIGVKIENLTLNVKSPSEAFTHAVTQPLKELCANGYDQQIILLVDALDEAVQFSGLKTIIDSLANSGSLPSQVRFVLTSRLDPAVLNKFESRQIPFLTLDAGLSENLQDVKNYLIRRINQSPSLRGRLKENQIADRDFIDAVTTASLGNFLYLVWLLRGITSGEQKIDDLQNLPNGLDGIYREFLRTRTMGSNTRQWRLYRPLLGTLAVARDALNANQLAQFTQTSLQLVADFVLDVSQFLDPMGAQSNCYRLYHQSLVDFLGDPDKAGEFWVDLNEWHHSIADFYWERHQADWSVLQDAYGLDHLAYHLYQSGQFERLKQLINPAWMKVRFENGGFTYDGFLGDVDLAWQLAYETARQQIEANAIPIAIAENVRLALIRTSIDTLSTNYVPALVLRALETGLWSPQRVLSVAQLVTNAVHKANMYTAILESEELTGDFRVQALERGLAAALDIQDKKSQATALAALAAHLQGEQREQALERGLAAALDIQDKKSQATALAALAAHLQGKQREQALERGLNATLMTWPAEDRLNALVAFIPHLQGEQREQAIEDVLNAALGIQDTWFRAITLASIAPHLQGEQKEQVLEHELNAALGIQDTWFRAITLASIAPRLQGEQKEQVLERELATTLEIQDESLQADVLVALAPHLQGEQRELALERALAWILGIQFADDRARALVGIAPHLQGEQREQALERGLVAALEIQDEWSQAKVLETLTPLLQGELREQALEHSLAAALDIQDEWFQVRALVALANHLQGEQREQALGRGLNAALDIQDAWRRANALARMAHHLKGEQREQALESELAATLEIQDKERQATSLAALLPHLRGEQRELALERGLTAALDIQEKERQATALAALAAHLQGEQREQALERGLAAALDIQDIEHQATALVALAAYLQDDQREQALERGLAAALEIHDIWILPKALAALAALAPHLQGDQREHALKRWLAVALEELPVWMRATYLAALLPHLRGEQREQALERGLAASLELQNEWDRANALATLAPHLRGEQREQALGRGLDAALKTWREESRTHALTSLAPLLQGKQREQALERGLAAALEIQDERSRVHALANLAPLLQGKQREQALERGLAAALDIQNYKIRIETLSTFMSSLPDRPSLLHDIRLAIVTHLFKELRNENRIAILDFIAENNIFSPSLLDTKILGAIAKHIVEICDQWRWL